MWRANLSGASLWRVNLSGTYLGEADLSGATLPRANLSEADLSEADLSGADLSEVDLSGARLYRTDLSGADLSEADLSGTDLVETRLKDTDLRRAYGLRLNSTYIRGAQFSPLVPRWQAALNHLRGRKFVDTDSWSILRQLYSGPRTLFLFFFVVVFALPYVGRAAFYSTASAAEQKVIDSWTQQKEHWREPHRAVGGPAAGVIATPFDGAERFVRRNNELRPIWQMLLKIDEGRVLPSVLAVLLVLYNVGVYWLITSVGPLRDEEERSGWSPAWADYRRLIRVHQGVTLLFYVSFAAFVWNVIGLLRQTVWVPAGG